MVGPLGENRNILHKSGFVRGNGINIPPISVGSENSEGRVCVRLFLRSAASEPDTDWNCGRSRCEQDLASFPDLGVESGNEAKQDL